MTINYLTKYSIFRLKRILIYGHLKEEKAIKIVQLIDYKQVTPSHYFKCLILNSKRREDSFSTFVIVRLKANLMPNIEVSR
jgi:hypothetical protein